jgi:hypothetical protein
MGPQNGSADRATWQRLLARWGVLTALAVAGLIATFFTALGLVSSRPGIGGGHDELLMAAYAPGLYRIAMVFDALGWFTMGGLIVIMGMALRRDATVRGPLAAALGTTAIAGVVGAFLRLSVVGDLGKQLAAGGSTNEALLSLYRSVDWIISAHFVAGQFTVGLAFLIIGSAALRVSWVTRPIAWLIVIPGITSLTLLTGEVAFDVFLFPVLLLHVVVLAIAGLAMAATWWGASSPTVDRLSSTIGTPAP